MAKLDTIVGLQLRSIERLHKAGILSIEHLLKAGSSAEGRVDLSDTTGLRLKHIESWVMQADLARITGIGGDYADLLYRIKVTSVAELAVQDPHDVHKRLEILNKSKRLVRRIPSISFITHWIAEAQKLPKIVTF